MEKLWLKEIVGSLFKLLIIQQLSHHMGLLCWATERDLAGSAYRNFHYYGIALLNFPFRRCSDRTRHGPQCWKASGSVCLV